MAVVLYSIAAIFVSYILGSLPTAYIVGRVAGGVDIRTVGSGNMGAMNVFYKIGFWPGLIVGITDAGKGALAVYLSTLLLHFTDAPPLPITVMQMVCGLSAIAGHNYPVFLKFKRGGRGAATACGIVCFLIPLAMPIYLVLFLLLLAITRYPTLSFAAAFLAFPATAWAQWGTPIDEWIRATLPALFWMQSRAVEPAQHILLIIYPVVVIVIPVLAYIPRIKEIKAKAGGNFKKAAFRQDLKNKPSGYSE
jgi:glycerol-3-phosphate acyltransferase PlsY